MSSVGRLAMVLLLSSPLAARAVGPTLGGTETLLISNDDVHAVHLPLVVRPYVLAVQDGAADTNTVLVDERTGSVRRLEGEAQTLHRAALSGTFALYYDGVLTLQDLTTGARTDL